MRDLLTLIGTLFIGTAAHAQDVELDREFDPLQDCYHLMERPILYIPKGDDSDVEEILRHVKCAESELQTLERLPGRDHRYRPVEDRIKEFVAVHEANLKSLRAALAVLGKMEKVQMAIDKLPEQCEDLEEGFEDKIAEIIKEIDDDDADDIEDLAKSIEDQVEAALTNAEDIEDDLKNAARQVLSARFKDSRDYPKRWDSSIEKALDRAADDIVKYYARALNNAERACDPIEEPLRLSYVVAALKTTGATLDASEEFVKAGEEWFDRTRAVWEKNCDGLERLRIAYCSIDWNETSGNGASDPRVKEALSKNNKDILTLIKRVVKEYKELKPEGDAVLAATGDDQVERLLVNMNKRYRGMESLLKDKGSALKGTQSPWIRTWIEYGKEKHKTLPSGFGCDVVDIAIPTDSRSRPDCFVVRDCTVIEFKPNDPSEMRKGEDQVDRYVASLSDYYTWVLTEMLKDTDVTFADIKEGRVKPKGNVYGGPDVFTEMADSCFKGEDEVEVKNGGVFGYDKCDRAQPICPPLPN